MSKQTEVETEFKPGQRIRAYDYNPDDIGGIGVFLEGEVQEITSTPFLAYVVHCDNCTGYGRVGKIIHVPIVIASFEFKGRIIAAC